MRLTQHNLLHNILCREQLVFSVGVHVTFCKHCVHLTLHILQLTARTAQLQERWETRLVAKKATWNPSGRDISNVIFSPRETKMPRQNENRLRELT